MYKNYCVPATFKKITKCTCTTKFKLTKKMYKYSCVLSCLQFYLILLPLLVPALITLLGYIFKPIFICNQTIFNFSSSLTLLAAVFCTEQCKCNTFTTFILWILILVHAIFVSICLHFFTSSSSSYNAAQAIIKVTIKP